MRLRRIGNNHLMLSVRMLEVIINSFFFHQARSKIEIGFAVLNTVIARFISFLQFVFDLKTRKNLLQNIRHADLLKNSALDFLRQKPDVRNDRDVIIRKTNIAVALRKFIDHSGKFALRTVFRRNKDRHALSDQRFRVNRRSARN